MHGIRHILYTHTYTLISLSASFTLNCKQVNLSILISNSFPRNINLLFLYSLLMLKIPKRSSEKVHRVLTDARNRQVCYNIKFIPIVGQSLLSTQLLLSWQHWGFKHLFFKNKNNTVIFILHLTIVKGVATSYLLILIFLFTS